MPLIPLALTLVPSIAAWLFGPKAAAVSTAVATAAATITGTLDPALQLEALADPAKVDEFRVELARIAAAAEAEQRANDLGMLQAQLADVAGARAQTVALAEAHSLAVWGAPAVSVLVLGTFGAMLWIVLTKQMPEGSGPLANVMLGSLAAMASGVVYYWTGSSASSRSKDGVIQEQSRALATSVPLSAVDK